MRQVTAEVLERLGYRDVQINTVFHQYMAAFPQSRERAAELIHNSAVTAALSGATRVITKTPAEALTIPTLEDNLQGLDLARRGVAAVAPRLDEARVEEECRIIRREVEAIFEQVMYAGAGSIAQGVVESFREGYLDIPFSPSAYNRGEVMTCRDGDGAVRYLSFGKLPFDRELRQFHIEKMQERRRADGLFNEKQNYLLIERDVLRLSRHEYEKWPLCS
jgi:methylaspartate mutase epsilon subunit